MRDLKIKVSELLKGFINWMIKSYHYTVGTQNPKSVKFKKSSAACYEYSMTLAIHDLGLSPQDFLNYAKPALLKAILRRLKGTTSFMNRDLSQQSDMTSAFKAYIKYQSI